MSKKPKSKAFRIIVFLLVSWAVAAFLVVLGVTRISRWEEVRPGETIPITAIPGVYFAAAGFFAVAGVLISIFVIGAESKGKSKGKARRL